MENRENHLMFEILPHTTIIHIPPTVARCPYCGGTLYVQLESWVQDDTDDTWKADEDCTHAECVTEPDEDYDAWKDWSEQHSHMPYVYQLPVDVKVAKWINERYRFDVGK